MKLTTQNKILLGLGGLLLIVSFIIGRVSKSVPNEVKLTDVSKYQRSMDSAANVSQKRYDTILMQGKIIARQKQITDSLQNALLLNHKTTANAVKAIQNFNVGSRNRFRDSVARANGFN